jgi:SPP1 family predicted phage head-tail adaptor
MNIGNMDRRIALQSASLSTNNYGEREQTWSTYATVWAQLKYRTGSEKVQDDQVSSTEGATFNIRYSTDTSAAKASDRVVYNGENYEILHIQELGRREGLSLVCELRRA